ncbi:DMT family transporter [Helicobacter sp.]|uniref:DMT family transporter n=1 Tax=Helicobacter sp. TaxID=218 RepID=UPI0025BB09E8|nr:DMT family transporter [Helicobacter sp.]MCI5968593.1 DMT family transporter [Helicobacter sp.]MDY2584416.1 DMT family transporter [Helicobacter sp.]
MMSKSVVFSILLVCAMLFWGASWPSSKVLVGYTGADVITFWRFFFALLASIPLVIALRIPLKIDGKAFKFLLIATVLNCLYSLMFFVGLNYGSAGKGGVLVTTMTPVFVYVLTFWLYKTQKDSSKVMRGNEILGLILGVLAGICLLDLGNLQTLFSKFNVFFVLCALDWAILTLVCQRVRIHPVAINFYITLFSAVLFSPIFLMQSAMLEIFSFDLRFWCMLLIIAVLSTAIGTSIYYMGIAQVGAQKASSYPLLVPVFALVTSFLILGEIPSVLTLIGGCIAIFAIYLINLYKPKQSRNL